LQTHFYFPAINADACLETDISKFMTDAEVNSRTVSGGPCFHMLLMLPSNYPCRNCKLVL